MAPLVRILILFGLVQLLLVTRKPWLCAAIYAGLYGILALMFGSAIRPILIKGPISFALAFVYFFLLSRMKPASPLWFFVLGVGLAVGLV